MMSSSLSASLSVAASSAKLSVGKGVATGRRTASSWPEIARLAPKAAPAVTGTAAPSGSCAILGSAAARSAKLRVGKGCGCERSCTFPLS